jgi:electron transfer flavoprotein-quinone oxidoreductase
MTASNYDVVVVGAGAAGLTAAIGLARAGFRVVAVEAAAFPGAENWSGCVYFCENLAHPDILGPEGVEALAWERRLVERGFFACDGQSLLGIKYHDPQAFRHCYTVLRPIYDHHLAQVAVQLGVALLNATTVESLIRENGRVIGVSTNRGPLYADLVFLAEGDASHLVTREGYERFTDRRQAPKFLQGIKQVIDLPPGAIEDAFGVGPEEGAAYEMLLRNGTLRGRTVHLNMGGFVYTNRQSLSVGLVLPVENLREHFAGDPNLLMEWFEGLPALRPWLREGKRGVFGAKLIRGGGIKDIPNLIDDGLAIGGAASAIGIDFPYPNFTGPATAMGLRLVQAARRIREEKGEFSRDDLRRHYLEPLQRTHYWQDVEFLRQWPNYVKRTRVFFERDIDLALGTAYIWTQPRRWFVTKWVNWLRLMREVAGPGHWKEIRTDLRHLSRALRFREVLSRPHFGQLLLDGMINAMRDLVGSPRANLPAAGSLRLHYSIAGANEAPGLPPAAWQRWFGRLAPVLASAARRVYANDGVSLATKLPGVSDLLLRQINMLDFVGAAGLGLAAGITGSFMAGWDRLLRFLRGGTGRPPRGLYPRYALTARQAYDLSPAVGPAAQHWEDRLAHLAYQPERASHIHVLWPKVLQNRNAVTADSLWHVCPAHVYEARVSQLGQLQVVVNFENCIKCETCWRASDLVDWGRDGQHRFTYPVGSPVVPRLLSAVEAAGLARPALPYTLDWWEARLQPLVDALRAERPHALNGQDTGDIGELYALFGKLEGKLDEFDAALAQEPRTTDRARSDYLEMLARYAQQLALRMVEVLRDTVLAASPYASVVAARQQLLELAGTALARAEERARRTWDQHFAWAAADGRQLRQHHLTGFRLLLDTLGGYIPTPLPEPDLTWAWLRAEEETATVACKLTEWVRRLDDVFGPTAWRDLERGEPLLSTQDAVLRDLIAQVPALDPRDLARSLHPPLRKALLVELGRRDPSLAYRVAAHLWARDLANLRALTPAVAQTASQWSRGDEWACFAISEAVQASDGSWSGEAFFVPAGSAHSLLLLLGDYLAVVPTDAPGLRIEPLATLGLRGASLARVVLDHVTLPEAQVGADHEHIRRVWQVLSAADLTSIAHGMADQLCRRAIAHATGRVQFPGLFHDEQARDPIGKFGAVKKMVAEMAARRYLLETLDHTLSPADFSASSVERAGLVKAVAAEALGTAPGSLSYNAGQIFGGTGFSEDDTLSKFYRDAAAWRFLARANGAIYRQHGEQLLRNWHPDGRRLASVPGEAQLFDPLVQRKALQAELDEVRVLRSQLRSAINDWQAALRDRTTALTAAGPATRLDAATVAEITERIARQDALLLASKVLLLRTHARLEHNYRSETEAALLRVWLQDAGLALEDFESILRQRLAAPERQADRPLVDPATGPPLTTYTEYLKADCPYDSGDFLVAAMDPARPRFVPEMIESDPELAARDREFRALLTAQFGGARDGFTSYERYVERRHRPDAEDLDFCRRHDFFRLPIPREFGGAGRPKVDYYLLTTNAQRLADVGLSLTIQVSSSLGTTPIMLAHDKDLPKALKELGAFIGDPSLRQEVHNRLEKLLKLLAAGNLERIERAYKELNGRLRETVLARAALRTLAHRFVHTWQQVGRAGQDCDPSSMQAHVRAALEQWREACDRAEEYRDELTRRCEACELFLRWIAAGWISGFALTEPSAGSDTARVATRARLRSVPVQIESDGVLRFVPAGTDHSRYLVDARRLEFRKEGVYYRWSETAAPALLHYENYDYETDDPNHTAYYDHGGRRVPFSDVTQLRHRDGQTWYDYWELTGAKMWITNGRMAGAFCLYAKTDEGVTGFLVDRHAEGLIVGKDEAKMGQLGSPTNELALQAVRVPRENVLGLEGRGQVNALETLNVGRAGLAMSAMAQMAGLIDRSRAFAQAVHGCVPDWVAWRLERMEQMRFSAEALAHEVVGRFEHPQTRSVRLESAIAKMLVSELLHRTIEIAEEIHGLAGQTQLHLVEKRKRDARVLTIYEGTNEIQRFFILKDLAAEVALRWTREPAPALPEYVGRETLELEALKGEVRQRVSAALAVFGQDLWQNPNFQANCFLLSEAVAWLKAADSTLGRLAWLDRQAPSDEEAEPSPRTELGRRALQRCHAEARRRLHRFDEELAHLRRGYYAPEIRAAELLFDEAGKPAAPPVLASQIDRPLSILVVVEPSAANVPHPQIVGGRILEAHIALTAADRAALETALRLRDQATAPVTIQVAAVGPKAFAAVLRETLSLGVDRARLVLSESDALAPDSAAAALAVGLGGGTTFDLVLGGSVQDGQQGLVARLAAAALGVPSVGRAANLGVRKNEADAELVLVDAAGQSRVRSLPGMVSIEAGVTLRSFTVAGYLNALGQMVEVVSWPKRLPARTLFFEEGAATADAKGEEKLSAALGPAEAARQTLELLGRSAVGPGLTSRWDGVIEQVASLELAENGVLALLASDGEGHLAPTAEPTVRAAVQIAALEGILVTVLLLAPRADELFRRAAGEVKASFGGPVVLLAVTPEHTSAEIDSRLLTECWSRLTTRPRIVVAEPWAESALISLQRQPAQPSTAAYRVRRLAIEQGQLVLETSYARGRLMARQTVSLEAPASCWITLATEAEVSGQLTATPKEAQCVRLWSPRLERFNGLAEMQRLLSELKQEAGVAHLADAEFILDVGFGIGNRDGYEAVIVPLEQALRALGVRDLVVGGSRKVTEELHLLPLDRQIGQSGVSVNPRVLLAFGISGAPQHLNYIGPRATILAFNRDPEAPLMMLNQHQARPRVFPVIGDLFETVPAFTAALRREAEGVSAAEASKMASSVE